MPIFLRIWSPAYHFVISFRVYGFGIMALGIQFWAFHSKTIRLGVTAHMPCKPSTQILATI